ncbi:hypothetical protein IGI04_006615 [Brassica rapa subsp. trilocularis]|uniref:Uncharacterized protein n=1 Tax=Brassica rapa subsp. trilocularis TaxID=1813537 RepID=A0ABQ7NHE2_BRACM|nr:hypothetical protein IGI04_006615 [Brassica rapa subsp. trilocularis]
MKVVVELGDEIDAKKACERQLRQKYKSLGALKIVTDRGLQVGNLAVIDISATTIIPPTLINLITLSWIQTLNFIRLTFYFNFGTQDTTWGKKRHAAKSSSRPWKRERQAHDLEEHKQKKRRVENLRIDPNVQSGEGGSQTEQRLEIPENRNVNAQEQADMERQNREAQEKAQEERRLRIDNERRQARLRLERLREALPDIGIERKEGDGF